MKLRRDGREADSAGYVRHIDTCLGCMACVTACPSGVQYDSLLEAARPQVERDAKRGIWDRAFRRMIFAVFPHPGRLRALSVPLGLYQKLGIQRLVHSSGVRASAGSACRRWASVAADHLWRRRSPGTDSG
jgi:glycolate oxidase iron-sulfur subunit